MRAHSIRRSTSRSLAGVALALTSLLAVSIVFAGGAAAAPWNVSSPATVSLTIITPNGVPGLVELRGAGKYVAAKPASGTSTTVSLQIAPGLYSVSVKPIQFDGRLYARNTSLPSSPLWVNPGSRLSQRITYAPVVSARDLHATSVGQTALGLAWAAPSGRSRVTYALRRTDGALPASSPAHGIGVTVRGTTATDSNLQPGKQYSYALFTQVLGRWNGPYTLRAGTASPDGTAQAAFIAAPTTLLAGPGDVAAATATGSGVRLQLAPQVSTPFLGAAVVLPASETLAGGFLGIVSAISVDGRNVDLVAAGLSNAFDYYEIDVPDFSEVSGEGVAPNAFGQAAPAPENGEQVSPEERDAAAEAEASATFGTQAAAAAAQSPMQCSGAPNWNVSFEPSISLGGHFHAKIDTYNFLGANIPSGASLNMSLTATVTGAMSVEVSDKVNCHVALGKIARVISASPVPISAVLKPVAQISIGAKAQVANLGVTATAGVQFSGTLGVTSGASFSGSPILSAQPLTPVIKANASIGAKLGGEVTVGPGAATDNAGVIAGIGGELYPLDAQFGSAFSSGDLRYDTCVKASVGFTRSLSVSAKAWMGHWDISKKITLSAFSGTTPYGGSPWYVPTGCKDAVVPQPSQTVLGPGVTKVSDSIGGIPDQWGHVDGFAPGQKTWVLSTGLINNALGTPDQFASTDVGQPGDDGLTALAGQPTFDAAFYQVTLIPTGDMLHVKYVFASEEYPEYVGSQYNDVMAVLVNGANCATVPGSSTPVSINTVNGQTNSAYYVDNSTGAAGYSTSMDGLTVPLTCSVPVTPGQQVTVRIGVADSADHIYDSAIALLDKGIWTD